MDRRVVPRDLEEYRSASATQGGSSVPSRRIPKARPTTTNGGVALSFGKSIATVPPKSRDIPPHVQAEMPTFSSMSGDRTVSSSRSSHRAPSPAAPSVVPAPIQPHHRSASASHRNPSSSYAHQHDPVVGLPTTSASHPRRNGSGDSDSVYIELSQLKHEQIQLRRTLEQVRSERDTLIDRLQNNESLLEDNDAICTKVQTLMDENMLLEKRVTQLISERNAVQEYLQRQTVENAQLRAQHLSLEGTLEHLKSTLSTKEIKIKESDEETKAWQAKVRELNAQVESLQSTVSQVTNELRKAHDDIAERKAAQLASDAVQEQLLATISEQHERESSMTRTNAEKNARLLGGDERKVIQDVWTCSQETSETLARVLHELSALKHQTDALSQKLPSSEQSTTVSEHGSVGGAYARENEMLREHVQHVTNLLAVSEMARQLMASEINLLRTR